MIYSHEVQHMCVVKKGPNHGPAPIPEEGKWVRSKEIKDIRCILNTGGSSGVHSFFHDTQLLCTYFVTNIIGYIHRLFQTKTS